MVKSYNNTLSRFHLNRNFTDRRTYPVTLKSRLRVSGSLKLTVNETIGQIIHDLVVIELVAGEYYHDLEMWVRGQSKSLKNENGAVR